MMVNSSKNNSEPWQSTIPQQMPWMSSHEVSPIAMQFGQARTQAQISHVTNTFAHNITDPLSQPSQAREEHTSSLAINPFDPNSMAHLNSGVNILTASQPSYQIPNQCHTLAPISNTLQLNLNEQPYALPLTSLTHLPQPRHETENATTSPQKRNLLDMDDESLNEEEPPTKQQLSENRLLERFGTLRLSSDCSDQTSTIDEDVSSDNSESDGTLSNRTHERKEFNRYVYLLFKDKNSHDPFLRSASSAVDRILRDEREKLNKAVILWSPPLKNTMLDNTTDDSEDDEEFKYVDHKDFLKKPEDSIIITEVEDDVIITDSPFSTVLTPDDIMTD